MTSAEVFALAFERGAMSILRMNIDFILHYAIIIPGGIDNIQLCNITSEQHRAVVSLLYVSNTARLFSFSAARILVDDDGGRGLVSTSLTFGNTTTKFLLKSDKVCFNSELRNAAF